MSKAEHHFLNRVKVLLIVAFLIGVVGYVDRGYYAPASEVFLLLFGLPILYARWREEEQSEKSKKNHRTYGSK